MTLCDICSSDEAKLFVIVEQPDAYPKGTKTYKAHVCAECHLLITTEDARYHGLRVTEVSQSERNESEAGT